MNLNTLPFQYALRGNRLADLHGQMLAAAVEQRDEELEDYLGRIGSGGSGGGTDEVWIGPNDPSTADPTAELWYDTDEVPGMGGMPALFYAVGISITGSFAGPATTCTLNIPAQSVAGLILVHGLLMFSRVSPASTDQDDVSILRDGNVVAQWRNAGGDAWLTADMQTTISLAANTATTITMTLQRVAGSGNRSVFADGRNNRLDAMWVMS